MGLINKFEILSYKHKLPSTQTWPNPAHPPELSKSGQLLMLTDRDTDTDIGTDTTTHTDTDIYRKRHRQKQTRSISWYEQASTACDKPNVANTYVGPQYFGLCEWWLLWWWMWEW